ncbi:hypothetical protein M5D96_013017 [Drosophila gunungcola]|uniref:Uncharacterized protein n=1 Tax=Drosophila gunungcola TaxID=103775 RepID=A0A9P9YC21_9MUSC|nr:hypothetical protein M5D96_013017 [Drosophila gunungcola]
MGKFPGVPRGYKRPLTLALSSQRQADCRREWSTVNGKQDERNKRTKKGELRTTKSECNGDSRKFAILSNATPTPPFTTTTTTRSAIRIRIRFPMPICTPSMYISPLTPQFRIQVPLELELLWIARLLDCWTAGLRDCSLDGSMAGG